MHACLWYLIISHHPSVRIHRFYNGGLIFSTVVLTIVAALSLYSFLLLVETRNKIPMSFGDIGGALFGHKTRMAVLIAITVSQVYTEIGDLLSVSCEEL